MSGHIRSLLPAMKNFPQRNEAPSLAPPPPRFARYASSSGPPPPLRGGGKWWRARHGNPFPLRAPAPRACYRSDTREARTIARRQNAVTKRETGPVQRGQGWACLSVFRYAVSPFRSPDERSDIRERWCGFTAAPRVSLRSPGLRKMKEAERRQTQGNHRRILRCGARSFGARTLVGVPPRLSPKGIIPSQRLSFRPGFLGRGLHGRYPPSPVPVQGCTSRPGHNAGGLIPKPPGSELQIRPRAPPSLP